MVSMMRWRAITVATALALVGCAGRAQTADPSSGGDATRYRADGMILDDGIRVELCLGGVLDSLPPQCDGVPVAGWDWDTVGGEQTASGISWGEFHVVGTYDGRTFTLLEAGPPEPPTDDDADQFAAPCEEPAGGWVTIDPVRAGETDRIAAMRLAESIPTYAGLWIDSIGPQAEGVAADQAVLVIAFTDEPDRHEPTIRAAWGGPLCLTRFRYSYRELRRAQRELGDGAAADAGLEMLWSSINVMRNRVELGTVVADEATQAAMDDRYGAGLVDLQPALRPVTP